jgi:hypothetical protein
VRPRSAGSRPDSRRGRFAGRVNRVYRTAVGPEGWTEPAEASAPWTEAFLFEADRAQTYPEVLRPALEDGAIVVADRGPFGLSPTKVSAVALRSASSTDDQGIRDPHLRGASLRRRRQYERHRRRITGHGTASALTSTVSCSADLTAGRAPDHLHSRRTPSRGIRRSARHSKLRCFSLHDRLEC